mgnify:CR=1 FL=1
MTQFAATDPIVVLSFARTPMGGMQGALSDVSATDLGATVVKVINSRPVNRTIPLHKRLDWNGAKVIRADAG